MRPSRRELAQVNLLLVRPLLERHPLPIRTYAQPVKVRSRPLGHPFGFVCRRAGVTIDADLPKVVVIPALSYKFLLLPRVHHSPVRKPAKIVEEQAGIRRNHRPVLAFQVTGFDRRLVPVESSLLPNVGQALSVRRPVYIVQPFVSPTARTFCGLSSWMLITQISRKECQVSS